MYRQQFKANRGILLTQDRISIFAQIKSITKSGNFLSTDQQIDFFVAVQTYLDSILNKTTNYDRGKIQIEDYQKPTPAEETFYKYVSKSTLNKYIKKGFFKLGNLNHYQKVKNNKIKDENEGYIHLIMESPEKQLLQSFCTGYNYLIFCGSYIPPSDPRSEYLKERFGPCVLKIRNTKSFRREIQKHLNINASLAHKVEYSEMKILKYKTDQVFSDTSAEIIDKETFSLINNIISPNIIFRKTLDYSPEYELRYAFKTPKDRKHPVVLHNQGLLDYIEIIE
ncbi:MAG: hypothetical protein E4G94_03490 [ANME-2 cluster archaeon]|nr:MAG: hypothetical protein E4G94_03490 [ANME-2 cluster archaeon]